MKKPWSISTTVRNPERIRDFLIILKTMEGLEWSKDNQKKFQILLIKNRLYGYGKIVDKIKSIGIILAVFLSFWTWLYTYKLDSGKFWAGLIISVFTGWLIFPIFIVWIWAILDTSLKDKDMYENYSKWKKK